MSSFKAAIDASILKPEELPLIHTSLSEHLPSFAASGAVTPTPCPILKESLVYLFYGRPAYRSSKGTKAGEPIALCPVCFVFKPRTASREIRFLHPCDTGAVSCDFLMPELSHDDLADLSLGPAIETARKAVGLLFETNSNYFHGKAIEQKALTPGSLQDRFYQLLRRDGPADFDDRKSAIEVAVNQPILLAGQLDFVVLPNAFLEDAAVRDTIINVWNCDPVGYPTFKGSAPAEYYSVVRNEVAKRFKDATRV